MEPIRSFQTVSPETVWKSSVCVHTLQGRAGALAGKWRGLRMRLVLGLRGAGFLLWGGLVEFLLYVGDTGDRADVDLVIVGLESLFALALGPTPAEHSSQVATQKA